MTASDLLKAIRAIMKRQNPTYEIMAIIIVPSTNKQWINLYKKSESYAAKVMQLPDDEPLGQSELSDTSDIDENFEIGYYQGVIQATDVGRCYNCNDPGHKWRDCTKPLQEGLK